MRIVGIARGGSVAQFELQCVCVSVSVSVCVCVCACEVVSVPVSVSVSVSVSLSVAVSVCVLYIDLQAKLLHSTIEAHLLLISRKISERLNLVAFE